MKKAYMIAVLIIAIAASFTVWAFTGSMTPYVDIRHARQSDSPVQVRGRILHDTAYYDTKLNALRFKIVDKNKDVIEVVYHGAKPDAFDTAPQTAAHGLIRGGVFVSDSLTVQCPSRYDDKNGPYKTAKTMGGAI